MSIGSLCNSPFVKKHCNS